MPKQFFIPSNLMSQIIEVDAAAGVGVAPTTPGTYRAIAGVLAAGNVTVFATSSGQRFLLNNAWFADTVDLGTNVSVLEFEIKGRLGATPYSGTQHFGGQAANCALRSSNGDLTAVAEDLGGSLIASVSGLSMPGQGVDATLNTLWDYDADQLTIDLNGNAVSTAMDPTSGGTLQPTRKLVGNTNVSGSFTLPADFECEHLRWWITRSGTRTLYKEISLAAQGSIAAINSDPWRNGGNVLAA